MMLAAAIAKSASNHVWFYAFTTIIVALAVLVVLFCIYWLFKIWEEEERVKEQIRLDNERTAARNQHAVHHTTKR